MYEDIDARLEAATSKAENASGIMHDVANGAEGEFVTTENGQVPTIPEFLKQLDDEINTGADSILTGATQARDDAEGFRDESEQFLIQTGNLAQEVSDNKDITDQNVITSTEQATIATEQAVIAQEAADQAIANTNITYMQSSPSQLDEYGYPNKTLYENGDGFITYYPEYAVFRKDGGVWEYVTPHLRNVLTFNGVSQYAVAPRVEEIDLDDPDLEFEIEWFQGLDGKIQGYILHDGIGGTPVDINLSLLYVSGALRVTLGGIGQDFNLPSVYSVLSIHFSSGILSFYADNQIVGSATVSGVGSVSSDTNLFIGARYGGTTGSGVFYQGQLSNIRIWTGGDRNTGTLTRHYRMDEGWRGENNQVLVNYATELGEELVVNGDFSDGLNGWTVINNVSDVDGAAYLVEDGGLSAISQGILSASKQYLTKVNVLNESGALRLETKSYTFYPLKGGYNTIAHTPFNTNLYIKTHQAGTSGYVDNVSVRQADGYGTYIGLTEASWTEEEV